MADLKLRQAIAHEAARLMYDRIETEYYPAKLKAARRLCRGRCKPEDLPSNAEIRQLVQTFAHLYEGQRRTDRLQLMRLAALRMMRELRPFRPRLIGSVLTGHIRTGSDIDIHCFTDSLTALTDLLDGLNLQYEVETKLVHKAGSHATYTHVHVTDVHSYELTVYPHDQAHHVFRSSITGGPIERASIRELEMLLERDHPGVDLSETGQPAVGSDDPYPIFRILLQPLEGVKQRAEFHPEGDVLYHSLQVFEEARDRKPYDVEFLTAALLHDVGKGIEPHDHVEAAVRSLRGLVSDRTLFLIGNHMQAHAYRDGTLSPARREKLRQSEDFDDLLLLAECDRAGRVPGAVVASLDEALGFLQDLEAENG